MAEPASLFGKRVAKAVAARESQVVLGLDPDPARLWPAAYERVAAAGAEATAGSGAAGATPAERAGLAVQTHCELAVDAAGEHCVAVKLQVACFERLGAPGWAALERVAGYARERGLLVIADAKRGDISISAAAYAQAFFGETPTPFGEVPGLRADALTANPLLGRDSLEPLVESAREHAGGLFVLVRTSNPGAADIQGLDLASGETVSERLAALVEELGAGEPLADVGAVVGATAPEKLAGLRRLMPRAVFLLPGVGPQGGALDALGAAFAPGRAGGLIAVSRGIVDAGAGAGGDPAAAAREAAQQLRAQAWQLSA